MSKGLLPRSYWQQCEAELDPVRDWLAIYSIAVGHEFPWDTARATEFALFHTFAVPEIGELLYRTGAFTERTQRRYDDTMVVLDGAGRFIGGESDDRTAIRRLNHMHGAYDIPNDQMLYVLTTFVVPPCRWIDRYGYRPMSAAEVDATVHYWKRMGELMGLHDIPADYAAFSDYFDAYERDWFAFSPGGRAVADATLDLIVSWYPAPLRPLARAMAISLMEPRVRQTLGYDEPPAPIVRAVQTMLGLRKQIVRRLPSRRTPVRAVEDRRIKSYPGGWDMARVGTFPERGATST
jgi:uncharacterized protein (DUF2236 family)